MNKSEHSEIEHRAGACCADRGIVGSKPACPVCFTYCGGDCMRAQRFGKPQLTDNRDAFYASVRAIEALCPACKQPQNAPSCERREHRLPSDTLRPAVWDGYPSEEDEYRS